MSASLVFRSAVAASAFVAACSQNPAEPMAPPPEGNAGALTQSAGSAAELPPTAGTGSGVGGAHSGAGGTASHAAGLAESGAGRSSSSPSAGSGGSQPGSGGPIAVTWKVVAESPDSALSTNVPSAAGGDTDGAVAYVERTTRRVVMQRFDAGGERVGSPVVLANDADEHSNVTLASDGKQYGACWNVASEVHCSLVDEQGTVHSNALTVAGQYATLVSGPNGWAIAYGGADKQIRLQRLTPALALSGSVVGPVSAQFSVQDAGPLFTSTPSGFALVIATDENRSADLVRMSPDLQSVVSAGTLGHGLWSAGQLVVSDTRAGVSLSLPYGSYLMLLDQKTLTAEVPIAGGGKAGTAQALVLTKGGIGAAWLDRDGKVRTRFFADGRDSDVGLDPRTPENDVLGLTEEGEDSYQQLVQVAEQTLLVARPMRYGSLYGAGAIRVAAVKFSE